MTQKTTTGVVVGKVTDVKDPENLGRVKVRYPHMSDTTTDWVPVASIMAGSDRGCFFMPEVDDEVLLAFQHGDGNHPYVIGCIWNPVQKPPAKDPRLRMIKSKNGHSIQFVDSTPKGGDKGALIIRDAHGNTIAMTNRMIRIKAKGHVDISAVSMTIMGRPVRSIGGPI